MDFFIVIIKCDRFFLITDSLSADELIKFMMRSTSEIVHSSHSNKFVRFHAKYVLQPYYPENKQIICSGY